MATPPQITFKLFRPVVLFDRDGNETDRIKELHMRTEMCAGDLRGIPMREPLWADDLIKLIGRMSGQPEVVVLKMSVYDMQGAGEVVMGFFHASPEDETVPPGEGGKTPSP